MGLRTRTAQGATVRLLRPPPLHLLPGMATVQCSSSSSHKRSSSREGTARTARHLHSPAPRTAPVTAPAHSRAAMAAAARTASSSSLLHLLPRRSLTTTGSSRRLVLRLPALIHRITPCLHMAAVAAACTREWQRAPPPLRPRMAPARLSSSHPPQRPPLRHRRRQRVISTVWRPLRQALTRSRRCSHRCTRIALRRQEVRFTPPSAPQRSPQPRRRHRRLLRQRPTCTRSRLPL
jgi:hypothetical protein